VGHRKELATVGTEINFRQSQHLFERAQHQGEWRAKLMADIGEKCRLGPVDLRQRFRAPALLLIGPCISEPCSDLAGNEIDEAEIGPVQAAKRIDSRDQEAGRSVLPLPRHRRHHSLARRPRPRAGRQAIETLLQIVDRPYGRLNQKFADRPGHPAVTRGYQGRRNRMAGLNARSAGKSRDAIGFKLIDQRKRQVLKIGRERALRRGEHLCVRVLPGNLRSKLPQTG